MDDHVCGRRFSADLDLCDLDERLRPGPVWGARSIAINRSRLWIRSRRMCYTGSQVATAVHMIDAEPVVLVGIVRQCAYDADSMYDLEIEFMPSPSPAVVEAIRVMLSGGVPA